MQFHLRIFSTITILPGLGKYFRTEFCLFVLAVDYSAERSISYFGGCACKNKKRQRAGNSISRSTTLRARSFSSGELVREPAGLLRFSIRRNVLFHLWLLLLLLLLLPSTDPFGFVRNWRPTSGVTLYSGFIEGNGKDSASLSLTWNFKNKRKLFVCN